MAGNPNQIQGDLIVSGNLAAGGITIPAGAVTNAGVAAAAAIASSKLIGPRTVAPEMNGPTTTITTQTKWLTAIKGTSGNLIDITATIAVAGSGGGMSVTIDLQKANGSGGAFASVLSAVITLNASTAIQTPAAGTITSPALVAGDILRAVVTATAGGGTLPQGLLLTLRYDESYT